MQDISVAVAGYRELRERLLEIEPEIDEGTLVDTLDGLTNLHDILAEIARKTLLDEALVEGLRIRLKAMQDRLARLEERCAKRRLLVRDSMAEAGIPSLRASDLTLSVRPGLPPLTIIDEKLIPPEFWVPREPRLDRSALLAGLRQGGLIPGVTLGNPQPVLAVRTR